jgi:hypothetical protein
MAMAKATKGTKAMGSHRTLADMLKVLPKGKGAKK